MKPLYEKILPLPERSFAAATLSGGVIDCEYHLHPEYEIIVVNSSFGSRVINDDISQFDAGTVNLIGPMVPHNYFNAPADSTGKEWANVSVIQFRDSFAGETLFRLPEMSRILDMLKNSLYGLDFHGDNAAIAEAAQKLIAAEGAKRIVLLLQLLDTLSRTPYRKISGHILQEQDYGGDRINRTIRFIHTRIGQGRTPKLAEAAANIGMGAENFSRYFLRSTGKNFIEYVIGLKLGKAANLLIHSDGQISEICFASGFSNLSNFNRHFLKLRGMTPGEYRRKFRRSAT